jgi:hypothetical protein
MSAFFIPRGVTPDGSKHDFGKPYAKIKFK